MYTNDDDFCYPFKIITCKLKVESLNEAKHSFLTFNEGI